MKKQEVIKRGNQQSQEAIRLKVVDYIKKKLGTQKQAAEIFGIRPRSVRRIWAKYKAGGRHALRNKKRGIKGGKKISERQSEEVRKLIKVFPGRTDYLLPANGTEK